MLVGCSHGNPGHRLNSTRDDYIISPTDHALRGEVDCLLARPALAINGGTRHSLGEACCECCVACYVEALLSNLAYTTYYDIFYQACINACALY